MISEIPMIAWNRCKERRARGEVPTMLGLQGILALIYDKIRRFNGRMDYQEIVDLASDALFAIEMIVPEEDISISENEIPDVPEEIQTTDSFDSIPDEDAGEDIEC